MSCIAARENGSQLFDLMYLSVWFQCRSDGIALKN